MYVSNTEDRRHDCGMFEYMPQTQAVRTWGGCWCIHATDAGGMGFGGGGRLTAIHMQLYSNTVHRCVLAVAGTWHDSAAAFRTLCAQCWRETKRQAPFLTAAIRRERKVEQGGVGD